MSELLVEQLLAKCDALSAKLQNAERRHADELLALHQIIDHLISERNLERARRFAASSEKGDYQANLFDEAEAHAASADSTAELQSDVADDDSKGSDETTTIEVAAHTRKARRTPLPKDLPRVVEEHLLVSADCECCGSALTRIEPIVSEQLDVIPAQVFVREHRRERGVCRHCNSPPITAPLPPQPIPKSLASPGLLAHTAVSKYADGLPLYRQSAMHRRLGVELPRQTLASHMIECGTLITPLINLLTDHLLAYDVLGIDETPVQVLKEPGKPAQSQSFMWVMRGGPLGQSALRFEYDPSRSATVAQRLLQGYTGYLQRDGYAAYRKLSRQEGIRGLGCWAHVRRKFIDALKALPEKDQQKTTPTHRAMQFITALYGLESRIATLLPDEKKQQRHTHAKPILNDFKAWLDRTVMQINPEGRLGQAIGYALTEWPYLQTYCDDGRLSIDNNGVENAIRPFAVGRKNWLFSDSQAGAKASAHLYSLIETAKANGLNPYTYLKHVFTELPKARKVEDFETLLPWNIDRTLLDQLLKQPNNLVMSVK